MARWLSKELKLNVASSKEAILFLEAIQKQIKIVDIIADYFPGKVTIRFEGTKEKLQEALEIARRLNQIIKAMVYPNKDGLYEYNIDHLTRTTGKTFPIKPLVTILQLKQHKIARKENILISDVSYSSILNIVTKMDGLLSSMPYEVSTSNLRELLIILSIIKDLSLIEAIDLAKKAKVVKEDESNRIILMIESTQALDLCLKITKQQKRLKST